MILKKINNDGRSMIEMLGVLAIVGVLSVTGIAGYSKAMEKWKVNKAVSEYSYILFGALEHLKEIQDLTYNGQGDVKIDVIKMIEGLNLFPNSWNINKSPFTDTEYQFFDSYGNRGLIYSRNHKLVLSLLLGSYGFDEDGGTITANYSDLLCLQLMQNLAYPLHNALYDVLLWRSKGASYTFYGDAYCNRNNKCLAHVSLDEMHKACSSCSKKEACSFTLEF